jgi:predicted transcriptional regulator
MSKKITVKIGSLEEAAKEFIDIWHQVEAGQAPQHPIEKISFKDQRLLFKTLTPKRFELLEHAHEHEGISIRALAKELGRDYSNVHQDVKILSQLGLIVQDEESEKYYVPWDIIATEISLPVIKKAKTRRHQTRRHHIRKRNIHKNAPRAAHG